MEAFDHVIIGGGILGASVAYHLSAKGAGSILLIERNEFASAASSRAAGLILQVSTKPSKTVLAKLTCQTIAVLENKLGDTVGFHRVGSLRIAASPEREAELDTMVQDALTHDIPFEWISETAAAGMVPWLMPAEITKAVFFPTDGYADPYLLSMAYLRAAQAQGATIRPRTAVVDILSAANRITGVMTSSGPIVSGSVIDAAGAWAALISERVGYPLPMAPVRSHYWIAEPQAAYGGDHPVTVLPDVSSYSRPEVGGLVIGVQESCSATFDARDLPDDPSAFSPTQGEEHWDLLANASEDLARFFPGIMEAQFSSYVCGLSSYTPDGEIILGRVPGMDGFLAVAGACGHGITLSAGMGDAASDLALGRSPAFDISAFKPDRFGLVDPFGEPFRDQCAAARAAKSRRD